MSYNNTDHQELSTAKAEKKIDFPYLVVVPYNVIVIKKLNSNAKIHFGCLAALSKKFGYCFASDSQLAEMHGVSQRQILRWQEELESYGLITRDTYNVSYRDNKGRSLWKAQKKIYVGDAFSKKDLAYDKNVSPVAYDKNVSPVAYDKNVTLKEESINNKSIKNKANASKDALSLSEYLFHDLKKKNSNFKKPDLNKWGIEIDKMFKNDTRTLEQSKKVIDWASANDNKYWATVIKSPTTLRKVFNSALIEMSYKPKDDKKLKSEEKAERIANNKTWLNLTLQKLKFNSPERGIHAKEYGAMVKANSSLDLISYNELNFQVIITNKLRSWGLKTIN